MSRLWGIGTVLVASLLVSVALAGPSASSTPKPAAFLFSDEFNGTHLDLAKWQPNWLGTGQPVSEENNCYTPSQVSVHGGALHLVAANKVKGCKDHPYISGLINTNKTFHFTTGRFEARVLLPVTSSKQIADWPAVWTDGYGNWPSTGESDIAEGITGHTCWAYHGPTESDGNDGCPAGNFTGWHVYAETVTRTTTTYYYDGHKVGQSPNVNAPHYLVFDLAVPYSGPRKIPAKMLVDYVHVQAL